MHDVTILCEYDLYQNWCECFMHTNDYFEYLLGDLGYMDEEMFVRRNLGGMNLPLAMT
jgi:hypothetical protein